MHQFDEFLSLQFMKPKNRKNYTSYINPMHFSQRSESNIQIYEIDHRLKFVRCSVIRLIILVSLY